MALLTPAELAAGNANKAIAAELSIAEETFKAHVSNILGKLGGNDRTHAAMLDVRRRVIDE